MLFFEGGKSILKVAVKMKRIIAGIAILWVAQQHIMCAGAAPTEMPAPACSGIPMLKKAV